MKIITISGLDGSGKSTQVGRLKDYLEKQGRKVAYFHAIQFGLAGKLSMRRQASAQSSVTQASRWKIFLRKLLLQVDLWRFRRLHDRLTSSGYEYLLSDRYFFDSAINIQYLENKLHKAAPSRYAPHAIIQPDTAIYLYADPEKIMMRDRKPDQGIGYLRAKKELFDRAAAGWKMLVVDGNRDPESIFGDIKKLIR